MRLIESEDDLAEGAAALALAEPRFAAALEAAGPPPLRRRPGGFDALLQIITEQQVSVAAGRAIFGKLQQAGATTPEAVLDRDVEALRALGLSRPKARTAHAAAEAVLSGALCFERQRLSPVEDAMAEMTALKGVGPWTAEIYQLFCVGRADMLPAADLALQEAARALLTLEERPSAKAFAEIGAAWSPWRSVAARILWSYYRVLKGREGVR